MHHNQNYHRLQGAPKLKPPPQGLSPKPPPQFAWMQQLRNHSEYHHHHSSSFYKLEALISAYWLMPQWCKFVCKWILSIQMFSDSADKPSKTRLHNTSQPRRERICNCWHVTVSIFGPVWHEQCCVCVYVCIYALCAYTVCTKVSLSVTAAFVCPRTSSLGSPLWALRPSWQYHQSQHINRTLNIDLPSQTCWHSTIYAKPIPTPAAIYFLQAKYIWYMLQGVTITPWIIFSSRIRYITLPCLACC